MRLGTIFIVIYMSFFGGLIGVLGKMALPVFDPITIVFLRLVITLACFTALLIWRKKMGAVLLLIKKHAAAFLLLALTGIGGGMILGFVGLSKTTAVNYSLLFNLTAVFMAIFAVWLLKERLTLRDGILFAIALFGSFLVVTGGRFSLGELLSGNWRGDLLVVLAGASWGFYSIYGPYLQKKNLGIDSFTLVFGSFLFAALLLLPYELSSNALRPESFLNIKAVMAMLLLGVAATAVLFYLWFDFIGKSGGILGSFVALSENVGGVILPVLFFHERPGAAVVVGGFLIILALFLQEFLSKKKISPPAPPSAA